MRPVSGPGFRSSRSLRISYSAFRLPDFVLAPDRGMLRAPSSPPGPAPMPAPLLIQCDPAPASRPSPFERVADLCDADFLSLVAEPCVVRRTSAAFRRAVAALADRSLPHRSPRRARVYAGLGSGGYLALMAAAADPDPAWVLCVAGVWYESPGPGHVDHHTALLQSLPGSPSLGLWVIPRGDACHPFADASAVFEAVAPSGHTSVSYPGPRDRETWRHALMERLRQLARYDRPAVTGPVPASPAA